MKDAEAEEEVGEERISVSLLRETSGLSRVRAPTPIVIGEEYCLFVAFFSVVILTSIPSIFCQRILSLFRFVRILASNVLMCRAYFAP